MTGPLAAGPEPDAPAAEVPEDPGLPPVESMNATQVKAEIAERTGEPVKGNRRMAVLRRTLQALRDEEQNTPPPETPPGEPAEVVTGEVMDDDATAIVPPEIADEVSQAIALREAQPPPALAIPSAAEFNAMQTQAIAIANTGMVPEAYRGRSDDVLAAFLFGRELGMGLMTALRDIYMIEGRPALAAHRQLGQIRRGGVVILESEATDERAYILAKRTDTGEVMPIEFTMEEAKRVVRKGKFLVDGDNWKSYPRDMLWARCVGRLTRRLASDLLNGLPPYTAEEVADFSGWGVEYGEQGQVQVRVGRHAQQPDDPDGPAPIRKEYPDWNIPGSWGELMQRIGERIGEPEAIEWIRQAVKQITGGDSIQALPPGRRKIAFQKCCFALVVLENITGDLAFDPKLRQIVAEAFAPRIDGVMLDGPPWRLGPSDEEQARPTREEWLEQQAATTPPAEAEPADAGAAGQDDTAEDNPAEDNPAEEPAADEAAWEPIPEGEDVDIEFGDPGPYA